MHLIDFQLFPDRDFLIAYKVSLVNLPNIYNQLDSVGKSALIKIDHSTERIVWGKSIGYIFGTNILILLSVSIKNERIYTILGSDSGQISRSMIAIFDISGNTVEVFGVIHPFDSTNNPNYYLVPTSINTFADDTYIFGSLTSYIENSFGVSSSSNLDYTFIRFNQDRTISWITSIDWMNQKESEMRTYSYLNQLYFIFQSNYMNYWLGALDVLTGYETQASKWIYTQNDEYISKTPSILIVSEAWIIWGLPYKSNYPWSVGIFGSYSFAFTKIIISNA